MTTEDRKTKGVYFGGLGLFLCGIGAVIYAIGQVVLGIIMAIQMGGSTWMRVDDDPPPTEVFIQEHTIGDVMRYLEEKLAEENAGAPNPE